MKDVSIETKRKYIATQMANSSIGVFFGTAIFPQLKGNKNISIPNIPQNLVTSLYDKAIELLKVKSDNEINNLFNNLVSSSKSQDI